MTSTFSNSQIKADKSRFIDQSTITQKLSRSGTEQFVKNSRLKQSDDLLNKKILENALDKKWEYLIKVGEMNAWKKQVKAI